MKRFVLLYHDCPPDYERPSHWDLMLESGDVLRTWALAELSPGWSAAHARTVAVFPQCAPLTAANSVVAEQLGDHRRDYLEYEGDVSRGRGHVIRVAEGVYTSVTETPTSWQFSIAEYGVSRRLCLSRSDAESTRWLLSGLE